TPDGRYYWWAGPRLPQHNYRAEIREVATGRLLLRVPEQQALPDLEASAFLAPNGRHAWIQVSGRKHLRYDLASTRLPEPATTFPEAVSPDSQWLAYTTAENARRAITALCVQTTQDERPWLEFVNHDGSFPVLDTTSFSHDGRYLAWGSQD